MGSSSLRQRGQDKTSAPSPTSPGQPNRSAKKPGHKRLVILLVLLGVIVVGSATLRANQLQEWWLSRQSLDSLRQSANSPNASTLLLLVYGEKLNRAGQTKDALVEFQAAEKTLPPQPTGQVAARVYARLGYALAKSGRDDEAIPVLDRARILNDNDPFLYIGYAIVFAKRQMLPFAVKQMQLAVELDPENAEAQFLLGRMSNDSADPQQAIEPLKRAIALSPKYAPAYIELGNAYAYQAKFPDAVTNFRKATELEPDNQDYRRILGAAMGMSARTPEQYKEALVLLEEALKANPKNDGLVFTLGQLHLRFEALEEARKYFRRAVELRPIYAEAWYNLARVEDRLGNPKEAEHANVEFKRLEKLHDEAIIAEKKVVSDFKNPQLRIALARRYRTAGNVVGAYWQYMTALKINPNLPEIRKEVEEVAREYKAGMERRLSYNGPKVDDVNSMGPPPPPEMMPGTTSQPSSPGR